MAGYRVNSSDSHIVEPPDVWTGRVEPKFRDRAPHLVREGDVDMWYCDGSKFGSVIGGSQAGIRFEDPEHIRERHTRSDPFEKVRLGGYVPEEHVKDMDSDGVYAGVLYPTTGLALYRLPDSEFLSACLKAYNDWLSEFCKPFPDRLKGIALLNIDDVQEGIAEMERCAKLGLAGALIPTVPPKGREYDSLEYEPLWAAAQDLDLPLSFHTGTARGGHGGKMSKPSFHVNREYYARVSITDMIASGVFERYPKLRVGCIEEELTWAVYYLERLDYVYRERTRGDEWPEYKGDAMPSDFFHRNIFLSFQEEPTGVRFRHIIGVDNLLWGSDYPHRESTFPRSQQILDEILADCTEEEKAKIAGGNTARIYHLT